VDFFTVPTLTFRILYVFFVIQHARRSVLHVNVTTHPTAAWVRQQLREAFPFAAAPRYLLMDRDAIFSMEVSALLRHMAVHPVRTGFQSPWQNGIAERWVGSCRRELLDHVIVLNEQHLLRLLREFLHYYHSDRTHLSLGKDPPTTRAVCSRASPGATVISIPRVGGLHHRYEWRHAA
jgi:putative transposase